MSQEMMLKTLTAAKVVSMKIPKPKWAVKDLIPEGLTILSGNPKIGKSYLALSIGISISLGQPALRRVPCTKGSVLYLALEDTHARLNRRLKMMLGNSPAPKNLHLVTTCPRLTKNSGGLIVLQNTMESIKDLRLVVIDTFEMVRIPSRRGSDRYREDYKSIRPLKDLAEKLGTAILLIHHNRKAEAIDPLSMVSGTHGLTGSVDGTLILSRERGRHDAVLYVRGRDTAEQELALRRDKRDGSWFVIGDAAETRLSNQQAEIIECLRKAKEPLTVRTVAEALKKNPANIKVLMHKMVRRQVLLNEEGKYTLPDNSDNRDGYLDCRF